MTFWMVLVQELSCGSWSWKNRASFSFSSQKDLLATPCGFTMGQFGFPQSIRASGHLDCLPGNGRLLRANVLREESRMRGIFIVPTQNSLTVSSSVVRACQHFRQGTIHPPLYEWQCHILRQACGTDDIMVISNTQSITHIERVTVSIVRFNKELIENHRQRHNMVRVLNFKVKERTI